MLPLKYLLGLFCVLILNCGLQAQNITPFVVVLDAGHGGKDGGAVGSKSVEKKIALKIVLELGRLLERYPEHIKVYYTRKKDVFIPLEERSKVANKRNADLFISVHCNASFDGSAYAQGSETFVLGNKTALSEQMKALMERENKFNSETEGTYGKNKGRSNAEKYILASLYQSSIQKNSLRLAGLIELGFNRSLKRKSRGVKQAGFVVLKDAEMPAVLVEAGFLTNPSDQTFLLAAKNQKKVAQAICTAVLKYKKGTSFHRHSRQNLTETNLSTTQSKLIYAAEDINKRTADKGLYYVQFASSITKFDLTITHWKKYKGQVQCLYSKGRYRCVSMKGGTKQEAYTLLKHWKQKGFSGAFIIEI
jgi:N-acetylmuramoyl-L-alanine amidase